MSVCVCAKCGQCECVCLRAKKKRLLSVLTVLSITKNRIKSNHSNIMTDPNCCREEINRLGEELKNFFAKSKDLKKEYQGLLVENLQKDLIIRELKSKLKTKEKKFTNFKNVLTPAGFEELNLISDSKNDDIAFVYAVMKDLYGNAAKDKTLSGRNKETSSSKFLGNEISRKDKNVLTDLFNERIQNESMETIDARKSTLNRCIRHAIDKFKRQNETVETE